MLSMLAYDFVQNKGIILKEIYKILPKMITEVGA